MRRRWSRRVRELAADHGLIDHVREHLQTFDLQDANRMVRRYAELCRPRPAPRIISRLAEGASLQLAAAAFQYREMAARRRELAERAEALQEEVEKRTAWAEEREQARQQEEDRRIRWVADLERQLEARFGEVQAARDALDHEQAEHERSREELRTLASAHQALQSELEDHQSLHDLGARHPFLAFHAARSVRPPGPGPICGSPAP